MERYEMAELLAQKAGVTLEEARQALVDNDWDMLDAMIALERTHRPAPSAVTIETESASEQEEVKPVKNVSATKKEPFFSNGFAAIWEYIKKLWNVLLENDFVVIRKGNELLSVPVLVLVVLMLVSFGLMLVVLIAGLFCGCQYRFVGRHLGRTGVNRAMDKMSDIAEDIKENFQSNNNDAQE